MRSGSEHLYCESLLIFYLILDSSFSKNVIVKAKHGPGPGTVLYDQHDSVNTIKAMYYIININLSVHPYPSINRYINLSVNLSINQSIYLSIDMSTLFHSTLLLDIFHLAQSVIRSNGT